MKRDRHGRRHPNDKQTGPIPGTGADSAAGLGPTGMAESPQRDQGAFIAACAVALVSLGTYALTLAPTVSLVDSGELIVAASGLGVAHPPGFPLYLIVAHLASLVPVGTVAGRVNFVSAIAGAAAATMMALVVAEAVRTISPRRDWIALVPGVVAGLTLAFSRTSWSYATVAEVYTLNTALILTIVWLMLRWRASQLVDAPSNRAMYAAAAVFGLALGVHHLTVLLTLPGIAALVVGTRGVRFLWSKPVAMAAAAAFAGLGVYLYLPLAAMRHPVVNWGDTSTFQHFWWHLSGRQYQTNFTGAPSIAEFARYTLREFGPVWAPLVPIAAVAGLVALARRAKPVFWMTLLVIAVDALFVASYEIAEDKDAYYLPAFAGLAIAAGAGCAWALAWARTSRPRTIVVALLSIAMPAGAFAASLPYANRSRDFVAHDYVTNTLAAVAPGALLLTLDWQFYSPSLYVQEIEGERPDVSIVSINLMRRSWYVEAIAGRYPDVFAGVPNELAAYLEDLRDWERDPDRFARDATLNGRINERFYAMLAALVDTNASVRPVFVTTDIASGQDLELARRLGAKYLPLPFGLAFRMTTDTSFQEVPPLALSLRGLADGTLKFDDDGVVRQKILPTYVQALVARGAYLAQFGRFEDALAAYRQALELDAGSTAAKVGILKCETALKAPRP